MFEPLMPSFPWWHVIKTVLAVALLVWLLIIRHQETERRWRRGYLITIAVLLAVLILSWLPT